jgi:nicotinamide mononucleotide transporter
MKETVIMRVCVQIKEIINGFTFFEKLLITINIIASTVILIAFRDYSLIGWLGYISAITNAICVVLVAKKRISNFAWGSVATATYAIVAFYYGHTAEWVLWTGYYLPMNFIGWFFWAKNRSVDNQAVVKSKKMSFKSSVLIFISSVAAIILVAWVISLPGLNMFLYGQVFDFGFDKYLVDAATSVLAIIAMILMVKRYREQWVMWICVNIISLILWSVYTFDPLMLLLWGTLLVNSVYGFLKWRVV